MRAVTAVWLAVAGALGAVQAAYFRHTMNPDGIAYLDMGDAYVRGDWATALRTHWSPLYGWLLGATMSLAQPPPGLEFPLVHALNWLVYCAALATFTALMIEVRAATRAPGALLLSVGYAAFVWCTLRYTPLSLVTPDVLVAVVVFAIAWLMLRLRRAPSWRASAVLGLLLGLGYLAKAPMLPLALVFLAVSTLAIADRARRPQHVAIASATLAVVVVPFIAALSLANGRFTAGDSAMLNYLWWIDGAPFVHWQGGPNGIGAPLHHSALLLDRPAVFAFDSPFAVTYAAWYAPEYWFSGAQPVFLLGQHVRAIGDALEVYRGLALDMVVPIIGLAALLALSRPTKDVSSDRADTPAALLLIVPALAALAMYAIVLVEARYVAPFVVLLFVGLLMLARWRTPLVALLVVAVMVQTGWSMYASTRATLGQVARGEFLAPDHQAVVAEALRSAGVQAGEPVASGNRALNAYWARLARLRIVAEVSGYDGTEILDGDPEARAATQELLVGQDVRAVVAYGWPASTGDSRWQPIAGTDYFYYLVPPVR